MKIDPRRPLVVMYHYVWRDDQPVPGGIRPMRASTFETQLDLLQARYDVVGSDAFLDRLDETSDRPACLLTFDDGTRDHAEVVTPILARRGLSGLFFIVSDAAIGKIMPTTHLAHWLLDQADDDIWRRLVAFAGEAALGDPTAAAKIYHYESSLRGRIKYAINMAMPSALSRAFALAMLAEKGGDEQRLATRWFASEADLRTMHNAGMTLGVHGNTHASLQQLGALIADEIDDCARFLRNITGASPTWWACPFGGSGAMPEAHVAMRAAMERVGIRAAVSTQSGSVFAGVDRLAIPRVDCIHVKANT